RPSVKAIDKRFNVRGGGRDDGSRHQLAEVQGEELFIGVTQPTRIVDEEDVVSHQLKELRYLEVRLIKWRVRAHEQRIERAHRDLVRTPQSRMIWRLGALEGDRVDNRAQLMTVVPQLTLREKEHLMVTRLGGQHERERGIALHENGLEWIH